MAKRRVWEALSENYRRRLESKGITEELYRSGASLQVARGHADTPEHPKQAFRRPDKYPFYLRRRIEQGKHVPDNMLPPLRSGGKSRTGEDNSTQPDIGSEIGWAGRDTVDQIVFFRSAGGTVNGDQGRMVVTSYNPDGTIGRAQTFLYNQADFYTLANLARLRGFTVDVKSLPHRDMASIIA